jgi:hypothetical protein
MKAYLMTTGLIFALIVVAHLSRMIVESAALARDPAYLAPTLLSAALAVWAGVLLRHGGSPVRRTPSE